MEREERLRPFDEMRSQGTELCYCLTNELDALIVCQVILKQRPVMKS